VTTHACHLDDLCGERCLDCQERLTCVGPDLAPRCDDHSPLCTDCAEPTTCTECLRVMREQAADEAGYLMGGAVLTGDPTPCGWCGHPKCDGTTRSYPHHEKCCLDGDRQPCWGTPRADLTKIMREDRDCRWSA
jgi:hypothetical protein